MYDLIVGRLSAHEQQEIEDHCRECAECRADLESLRSLIEVLPSVTTEPSEERSPQFWSEFPERVQSRIGRQRVRRRGLWAEWADEATSYLSRSWKPVGAAAALLTVAVAAFVLVRLAPENQATDDAPTVPSIAGSSDTTRQELVNYLRKSNMLLVGLANRKVDDDVVDLSAERDLSRQLVRESRQLRDRRLDPEASQLVGDLERILIEIASRNGTTDREHFDLIRSGIKQENLLFKVRMIETVYEPQAQTHERTR